MKYIDNDEFENVIRNYQENPKEFEEEFIRLFSLLITNIFRSFNFTKVEEEDAYQECFLLVLKKIENFSSDKGPAFNYFTTVILNNMRYLYTKEKRHIEKILQYIKIKGPLIFQLEIEGNERF